MTDESREERILRAAVQRYVDFDESCDYETPYPENPLDCKGRKEQERGVWCHWCQLRGALMGIDDPEYPVIEAGCAPCP